MCTVRRVKCVGEREVETPKIRYQHSAYTPHSRLITYSERQVAQHRRRRRHRGAQHRLRRRVLLGGAAAGGGDAGERGGEREHHGEEEEAVCAIGAINRAHAASEAARIKRGRRATRRPTAECASIDAWVRDSGIATMRKRSSAKLGARRTWRCETWRVGVKARRFAQSSCRACSRHTNRQRATSSAANAVLFAAARWTIS